MGSSALQALKKKLYGNREVRMLLCGLDAAGKTTVLYRLKLGEIVTTIPTIGFNVETLKYKSITFNSWDVGGRDKIRPLLRHYFANTDALVYVVDSNDHERISEAKEELHTFLCDKELKDTILLVIANKQDLPGAMSVEEVTEKLNLHSITSHSWYVQPACATAGDGLYEGLDWLHSQLTGIAIKESVSKPLQETKESVTKSSMWSSIYSTLTSFYYSSNEQCST